MKQQQIVEGNRVIGKFLGLHMFGDGVFVASDKIDKNISEQFHDAIPEESWFVRIKFHKDWNWLMPIVKKCKEIGFHEGFESETYQKWEEVFDIDFTMSSFLNNEIDQIWYRCVEFLKWYKNER